MWLYRDRKDAGIHLSQFLEEYMESDTVVLAVPRGGVVVASEICKRFSVPMDLVISRKIGAPENPEMAIAAVDPDGEVVMGTSKYFCTGISIGYINRMAEIERQEITRRLQEYRGDKKPVDLRGRLVVVVDDGIATGLTIKASLKWVRKHEPRLTVLAVPVAPEGSFGLLADDCDVFICPLTPKNFYAVGQFYEIFEQTSDDQVVALLRAHNLKPRERQ